MVSVAILLTTFLGLYVSDSTMEIGEGEVVNENTHDKTSTVMNNNDCIIQIKLKPLMKM